MSSRGQIVIPKVLREAAGMAAGDEVEVILDGQRLILCPCRRDGDQAGLPAPESDGLVREARPGYGVAGAATTDAAAIGPATAGDSGGQGRLSKIWADRVRALAGIERLRAEFAGLRFEDLWRESRRELEGGEPGD
jgi:AbrB family looped-hinge helix DNA binding protein